MPKTHTSDDVANARKAAEASRQKTWQGASFLRELFLGHLRPELLLADDDPYERPERPEFRRFYDGLKHFLQTSVDPAEIDQLGDYPKEVLQGLAELGAFGMKIKPKYGGLGLTHREYVAVMQMVGSYDGNLTALLSAHQSIGVPHPVEMFGSEDLKTRYLPRCAKGAISAFALTEEAVGSDPSKLATVARVSEDGESFILDGQKLWCTNGTLAELLVVLARNPETHKVSCFVVETNWEGVKVEHRCHFMGLRALANGVISFNEVRVPRENLIGDEGSGLRVALATLNTGRLTLPAATAGAAKYALELCRKWAKARVQWGQPIGKHEAIAHGLSDMATTTYAMEAVAETVGTLADRKDRDIRLEAAAAKEWNTVRGWELTDKALQIRGGRGYETETSLAARGEAPIGIERMLRDCRVNRIFEGSSEVMHLFIAREAVDRHLEVSGKLIEPDVALWDKVKLLPSVFWFYATWYPTLWLGFVWAKHGQFGPLAKHVRYLDRASRRLARAIFHGMLRFGPALEKKQAFLFRAVDVALELFAFASAVTRANKKGALSEEEGRLIAQLAASTEDRVDAIMHAMWHNQDGAKYAFAQSLMAGDYAWLEERGLKLGYDEQALTPKTMEQVFAARRERVDLRPQRDTSGIATLDALERERGPRSSVI
ncbi:MAG TPA: acyl-CoA dehydrogenase family protein [Polyangiales bacterium]|nr:acyl-CoA dehydrogenase family protein [Polyangiales bacterium]